MEHLTKMVELGLYLKEHNITNRQFYYNLTKQTERNKTTFIEESKQAPFSPPCTILLDQSTSTGYAIFDNENQLVTSGEFTSSITTSLGRYKFALKDFLEILIEKYAVETILYEHVFDGKNPRTTEILNSIKFMIKDIETERIIRSREPIVVRGVDHGTWKKELAKPNKFKKRKNDKLEIRKHVEYMYPLILADLPQDRSYEDMVDAIGMGIGMLVKQTLGGSIYKKLRYNKRLSLDQILIHEKDLPNITDKEAVEAFVAKLRKPFREAFLVGDVSLREDSKLGHTTPEEVVKRYLSHLDTVYIIPITPSYQHFGMTLLMNNISLEDVSNKDTWYLVSARKRRLI